MHNIMNNEIFKNANHVIAFVINHDENDHGRVNESYDYAVAISANPFDMDAVEAVFNIKIGADNANDVYSYVRWVSDVEVISHADFVRMIDAAMSDDACYFDDRVVVHNVDRREKVEVFQKWEDPMGIHGWVVKYP